jgi:hypothetical protein
MPRRSEAKTSRRVALLRLRESEAKTGCHARHEILLRLPKRRPSSASVLLLWERHHWCSWRDRSFLVHEVHLPRRISEDCLLRRRKRLLPLNRFFSRLANMPALYHYRITMSGRNINFQYPTPGPVILSEAKDLCRCRRMRPSCSRKPSSTRRAAFVPSAQLSPRCSHAALSACFAPAVSASPRFPNLSP